MVKSHKMHACYINGWDDMTRLVFIIPIYKETLPYTLAPDK